MKPGDLRKSRNSGRMGWAHGRWCVLAGALLALALGGCTPGGPLAPRGGGMAGAEAADLSLAVAQIRAKYPGLKASQPPYEPRTSDALPIAQRARLALRGAGKSVAPGALTGKDSRLAFDLYLDKSTYQEGYVLVRPDGGAEQRWPILAYDLRGDPEREFEFVYLLSDPGSALAYLVILCRDWKEPDGKHRSYEATIVRPGEGARVERWQQAYYFDLGLDHRLSPQYQEQVAAAAELADQTGRDMRNLAGLKRRRGDAESRRKQLAEQPPKPEEADARVRTLTELDKRIGELQSQWEAGLRVAEERGLKFYALRADIARSFAEFLESNYYRWQPPKVQQDFFDRWARIDEPGRAMSLSVDELLPELRNKGPLERARQQAADAVAKYDNASKRPPKP